MPKKMSQHIDFLKSIEVEAVFNVSGIDLDPSLQEKLGIESSMIFNASPTDAGNRVYAGDVEALDDWISTVMELLINLQATNRVWIIGSESTCYDCLLIACLRRIQSWTLTSILSEFRLHSGPRRYFDLEQVIERFDPSKIEALIADDDELPDYLILHRKLLEEEKRLLSSLSSVDDSTVKTEDSTTDSLRLMENLFFSDNQNTVSEGATFDRQLSLVDDKDDDD